MKILTLMYHRRGMRKARVEWRKAERRLFKSLRKFSENVKTEIFKDEKRETSHSTAAFSVLNTTNKDLLNFSFEILFYLVFLDFFSCKEGF